jgi:hypothetical protein
MPLTVCLAVIGRYIPEFGYLNVLLGVEPVLSPEARFYQRLVAMDQEEAEDLAEDFANEHGLLALHERVVIPALVLGEQDRHAGALDEQHQRFIFDTTRHIVEYVEERRNPEPPGPPARRPAAPLCVVPAHDEADHVAALVLARVLPPAEFDVRVSPYPLLAAEILDFVGKNGCKVACISAMPPRAATHAAYLTKRLKQRFPEQTVLVALWTSENIDRARARLAEAGVDQVVTRLSDAVEQLRQLAVPATLELQQQKKHNLA